MKRKNKVVFPVEIIVAPLRDDSDRRGSWLAIVRDITMRTQFRQIRKIEGLGRLAGGIAHDFNNILTPIIGYTELMAAEMEPADPQRFYLQQVHQAAYRAKALVQQILTFSRQNEQELKPVRVGFVVQDALKLVRASLPATIKIRLRIETEEDTVLADLNQLHQVLMNLCSNAADAMHEDGGLLEIRLSDHLGPITGWSEDAALGKGPWLRLSVKDTGPGIDTSVLPRIFDPFFTTKKPGAGTGIGLSVVRGIVKSFCGVISVQTASGEGTVFHVYLAKTEAAVEGRMEKKETTPPGNGEKILLVDDEPMIGEMLEHALSGLGYRVITRTNGSDALGLFIAQPDGFDVVITDQTMPGLTGMDMAEEMLTVRPDLPIIVCTGLNESIPPEKANSLSVREYAMKPFSPGEMAVRIRRVIDNHPCPLQLSPDSRFSRKPQCVIPEARQGLRSKQPSPFPLLFLPESGFRSHPSPSRYRAGREQTSIHWRWPAAIAGQPEPGS